MLNHFIAHPRTSFTLLICLTLIAAALVGVNAYHGARAAQERDLLERVEAAALLLDPREIMFLRGEEGDIRNPFYMSLKYRFLELKKVHSDIRFIYLAGQREDSVFFYLDSEPDGSSDYSPPGSEYPEASGIFREVFATGQSRFEGPLADQWGTWISAFAPVRHPETGQTAVVVGMDISASVYRTRVISAVALPVGIILLFSLLLWVTFLAYKKEQEVLAIKADFLSLVSHDLRSPLTGVAWAIQMIRGEKALESFPRASRTLAAMEGTVKGLLETIESVLEYSRRGYRGYPLLKRSDADMVTIVREVNDMLTLFAQQKNITFSWGDAWPRQAILFGDREKIKRAVLNVVANAIKYAPPGSAVRLGYRYAAGSHVVSVSNSGPTIPASQQSKVFAKFFRVDDALTAKLPGTGLGLYSAKEIIEAHDGLIWFDSEPGKDTTFYIALPAKVSREEV